MAGARRASWLTTQLQTSTTYTFIVRHEPTADNTAPGVTPSEAILAQYPYTLKIVGHTHEFSQVTTKEIIVGNGGAPLASSGDAFGYALVSMTANGDLSVAEIDATTNLPVATYTVAR